MDVPVLDDNQDGENPEEHDEVHVHFLEDIYDTLEGPVRKAWR